jgi:Protein of unknown function (DUF2924)
MPKQDPNLMTRFQREPHQRRTTPAVSDLPSMSRQALVDAWVEVLGRPPIRGISRELLVAVIAWYLQARQQGGLAPALQRKLDRLAAAMDGGQPIRSPTAHRPRPGTNLEREWQGQRHVVGVTEAGFAYRGDTYRSLSQIARLITGTRWNGPAFFGLRQGKGKSGSGTHNAN